MSIAGWLKTNVRMYLVRKKFPDAVIHSGVIIDKNSTLGKYSVLFQDVIFQNSTIGAFSYIQSGGVVIETDIGKFCSIAGGVNIDLIDHPMNMVSTSPVFYDKSQPLPKFLVDQTVQKLEIPRTVIGSDVWIGQGVKIRAGAKIGTGSVIGAGSIVTKDIPPYTISVGSPCRPIRQRFPVNISKRLMESKWWEFDEEKLKKLAPLFSKPEDFLAELEK